MENSATLSHFSLTLVLQLESLGIPVILTDTPFTSLERDAWTFESLSQSLKYTLLPFKSSSNPIFKYHANDQPLSAIPEFNSPQGYQNDILPGDQLLNRVLDNATSPRTFLYASGEVELLKLSHPLLQTDLDELTFSPHKGDGQVNFWIGMGGVTAYTHYDTSHNLHATFTGRKRFLIYPPSSYQQLHLYPCLHQLYRQTQVAMHTSLVPRPFCLLGYEATMHTKCDHENSQLAGICILWMYPESNMEDNLWKRKSWHFDYYAVVSIRVYWLQHTNQCQDFLYSGSSSMMNSGNIHELWLTSWAFLRSNTLSRLNILLS